MLARPQPSHHGQSHYQRARSVHIISLRGKLKGRVLSGVAHLWDGDDRDVHIGAQPVRVLNGIHHPGRLPRAAQP